MAQASRSELGLGVSAGSRSWCSVGGQSRPLGFALQVGPSHIPGRVQEERLMGIISLVSGHVHLALETKHLDSGLQGGGARGVFNKEA